MKPRLKAWKSGARVWPVLAGQGTLGSCDLHSNGRTFFVCLWVQTFHRMNVQWEMTADLSLDKRAIAESILGFKQFRVPGKVIQKCLLMAFGGANILES